ncbi:hypothetical protein V8G54_010865 [Vigna mungo]|uniref:Uncharacterized protein n=1 Tax=Vigna mungo TaxID=3915 RepID=A0AAQ3S673_VIGMU
MICVSVLPDEYDNDEHCQLFKQKKDEENGKEDEPNVCKSVARMDYYKAEHLAGVTFHLQDELPWYVTVRRFTPKHLKMHSNIDGYTPKDMLEIEHDEMLKEAKNVIFAAAYTTEAGNENDTDAFRVNDFLFSPSWMLWLLQLHLLQR